ncbi:MAG TPA: 4Fe-4S dicluster domain-containing protein, partial [Armatimonadetes bacterium]|nr:4Fe-4S dicluster domain-containing protein [Armatimonadota bacterium]
RRACVFSLHRSAEGAAEAALRLSDLRPTAAEMVDQTLLGLAREQGLSLAIPLPVDAGALLIVEFEGESGEELRALAEEAKRRVKALPGTIEARVAREEKEAEEVWNFRRRAVPLLHRRPGPVRPVAIVEDLGFPPEVLPEAIGRVREVFRELGLEAALYGSMLDGNLHCRPMVDIRRADLGRFLLEVGRAVFEEVVRLGGTISAEHGDGLSRAPFLELMHGEDLVRAFREVKGTLDPLGILNPGSKVSDDPEGPFSSLVFWAEPKPKAIFPFEGAEEDVRRCNACGLCREVCPPFKAERKEPLSPRGRMTLALALLSGRERPREVREVKRVLRRCLHCLRCALACPSGVDPAWADALLLSSLAPHRGLRGRVLSSPRLAARMASLPLLDLTKRLGVRLLGISTRRPLPMPSFEPIEPLPVEEPVAEAVYFPGCYSAIFNPPWGRAVLAFLHDSGVEAKVVFEGCCGAPAVAKGRFDIARKAAERAAKALLPEVDAGRKVVLSDPTCLTTIRRHWPRLLGKLGEKVAENCLDVVEFVLSVRGSIPEGWRGRAKGRRVLLHLSCHFNASESLPHYLRLLSEAGAEVEVVDACCGLAGTWGLMRENERLSERVGISLFEEVRKFEGPVLTPCGSCRDQIEFATGIRALHPLLWLWGIAPAR